MRREEGEAGVALCCRLPGTQHIRGPGLSPWKGKRLLPRALKQPEVSPVQLPPPLLPFRQPLWIA